MSAERFYRPSTSVSQTSATPYLHDAQGIHVTGLKELGEFLKTFPEKLQKNIMRAAQREGAKVVAKEAARRCPVGTGSNTEYGNYSGALRDSIRVTTKSRGTTVITSIIAGGKLKNGADLYWAHIIEFTGARPHWIFARKGSSLSFQGVQVRAAFHPGMAAKPFMAPALDMQAENAVRVIANYMRKKIDKNAGLDTTKDIVIAVIDRERT